MEEYKCCCRHCKKQKLGKDAYTAEHYSYINDDGEEITQTLYWLSAVQDKPMLMVKNSSTGQALFVDVDYCPKCGWIINW